VKRLLAKTYLGAMLPWPIDLPGNFPKPGLQAKPTSMQSYCLKKRPFPENDRPQ
jgi:hypothetical protein